MLIKIKRSGYSCQNSLVLWIFIFLSFKLYMHILICPFAHTTFQSKYNQKLELAEFGVWHQLTFGECRRWRGHAKQGTAWTMNVN